MAARLETVAAIQHERGMLLAPVHKLLTTRRGPSSDDSGTLFEQAGVFRRRDLAECSQFRAHAPHSFFVEFFVVRRRVRNGPFRLEL